MPAFFAIFLQVRVLPLLLAGAARKYHPLLHSTGLIPTPEILSCSDTARRRVVQKKTRRKKTLSASASSKDQKRNPRSSPLPFAFRMSIPRTFGGAPTHRQYSWITCECNAIPWTFQTREDRGRARADKRGNAEEGRQERSWRAATLGRHVLACISSYKDTAGWSFTRSKSTEPRRLPTAAGSSPFRLTAPLPLPTFDYNQLSPSHAPPSLGDRMVCGGRFRHYAGFSSCSALPR